MLFQADIHFLPLTEVLPYSTNGIPEEPGPCKHAETTRQTKHLQMLSICQDTMNVPFALRPLGWILGGWGLAYMAGTTWGKLSFKPWDGIGMNWVILHPFWDVLKWGFPKIRVPQNHPKLDHGFGLPPFSETSKYCCKESSRLATCVCF
jgi:hypothetical protein